MRTPMPLTPYHARLFANELTKRAPSDSIEKLTAALADAQVDLNPHQIEAAYLLPSSSKQLAALRDCCCVSLFNGSIQLSGDFGLKHLNLS
jgi:hypothetical protein